MKKFELPNLKSIKWLGYVAAAVAAVATFSTEMDNIKKEEKVKSLEDRVSKLESKDGEA